MRCLFDDFFKTYFRAPKEAIDETLDNTRFYEQKEKLREAVYSAEYSSILGQLDSESFRKYYEKVGEFAKAYNIDTKLFTEETPAAIEDINDVLGESPNIAEKLDLINGFTEAELRTDRISFGTKTALIESILDCWFVGDDKEQGINRLLMSLTAEDRLAFVNKIGTDRKFLNRLIQCVNGKEKDEMLAVLGEIFIGTGLANEGTGTAIDNGQSDKIEASYNNGSVSITVLQEQGMGARDYRMTPKARYTVNALENISMYYDGRLINVPALLLLNSLSNSMAEPEGLFYNYRNEDIDWNTLSDEKKDEYFYEFVKHYLPSGFFAAIGNPVHLIAVSLISACFAILTGGTGAMAQLSIALSGAGIVMSGIDCGFAVRDIVNVGKLKDESQTVHEVKQAAKLMAKHIARLTLNGIDIICNFVDIVKSGTIIKNEKIQIKNKELILNAEKKLHANINEDPIAVEVILAKIASGENPPEILVKISTGSSEKYGTIAQAQKKYSFVCDYEELRGLSNIDIQKKLGFETFNDTDLYATFIIPPKNVKVEQVTFDSLKNDVKNLLSKNDEFGKVFRKSVTQIDDLNLYDGNVLNEKRLDEIFKIYENTFGVDAVENLSEELYDFRKAIEGSFGTNPLFTGNYHTTTIDGDVGVREYVIKRIGNDWDNERLRKEGFSIYETKILTGEKNE